MKMDTKKKFRSNIKLNALLNSKLTMLQLVINYALACMKIHYKIKRKRRRRGNMRDCVQIVYSDCNARTRVFLRVYKLNNNKMNNYMKHFQ